MKRQPAFFNLAATMMAVLFAMALPSKGQISPIPTALTFSAAVGSNPPSQVLTVNSVPIGVAFSATATTNNGGNWLSVVPSFGTTVSQVEVRVTSNTLTAGTYSGQVTISGGTVASATVPVTLTIGGGGGGGGTGAFTTTPQSLTFNYDIGGALPGIQTITTTSATAQTFSAAATTSTGFGWLSVTPATVGPTTIGQFTVSVSPTGLTVGTYSGQITISAGGQSSAVSVFLTVTQGGGGGSGPITVSPASLTLSAALGQTTPAVATLTIGAIVASSFTVVPTVTSGNTSWLSVSPTTGSTGQAVTVSANASGLPAGSYTGTLGVFVAGVGQLNVPVTFNVGTTGGGGTGIFTANPQTLNFNYQPGGAIPGPQTITTTSASSLTYTATPTTFSGSGWLSVTPTFSGPSNFATFTVSVSPQFLTNGTYSGQISITGGGSTVNVPVTITVGSGGGGTGPVTVLPSSLNVTATAGQTSTIVNSLTITSTQASTFTVIPTTTLGGNWLGAIPSTGNTGTVIQVTANPTGLPAGTYSGNLAVVVTGQGTVNVPVTMTVGSGGGGTGGLTFSPTTLSFSSTTGATPPAQVVNVTAPTTTSFTASASTTSGNNWLTVFQSSTQTNATITVSVNPTGLTPNATYFGTVVIAIPGAGTQSIPVTFAYGGSGGGGGSCLVGTYNPSSLTFNYTIGQNVPSAQTFTLTTPGNQPFTLSSTVVGNWLSAFPPSGVTSPSSAITVTVQPQGLPAGNYSGNLRFTFTTSGQTCDYPVTLVVSGGTGGGTGNQVTPSALSFSYLPGTGSFPANQSLTLSTTTPTTYSASVQFQSGQTQGWLLVAPSSGTTVQSVAGQSATALLQVGLTTTGLPVGLYNATVLINAAGQTFSVPVTLNVGNTSTGALSPSQLSFNHQLGTTVPGPQLLTIQTPGGVSAPFTATASTTSGGSGWLTVNPTSAQAPGVVAVSVNPQALGVGTYSGTVSVTTSGSQVPTTVPVTLNVSAQPVLRVNPTKASFNYQVGGSVPPGQGQNVEVTSSSSPLTFSVSSTVNSPFGGTWLSVSQNTTTTPATVSIQVNASNLSAGSYAGTVTVTAAGQQGVTIPVALTVSASPLINADPQQISVSSAVGGPAITRNLAITTTGASVQYTPSVSTVNGGTQWLQVTPASIGVTPANLVVTLQPAGLTDGTYFGSVILTATGTAGNSPVVVPVVLVVGTGAGGGTGGTALSITPTSMTFTQIVGGGLPPAQTLNIGSTGNLLSYTLNTSTASGGSWLTVTPPTGNTPGTAQVQVSASTLPLGSYSGSIIISASGASNNPQVIPVTLNVITAPVVTATPTSLTFNATSAAGNPAAQTITVQSSGSPITFSTSASVSSGGVQWLSVTPQTGSTPGTVTVSVNTSGLQSGTYSGTVTINTGLPTPITIPVTLNFNSAANAPTVNSVTNAANFQPTAATPGLIVAIFGSNLGPDTLVQREVTSANTLATTLSNVRVLFDGIPAPLIYVRRDVVSAVVPYEIGGRANTNVRVEYNGVQSQPVNLRVQDTSPGIFTTNQQGNGQGAIQNSDFSLNGPGNAAARGSFATVYITGEGPLTPSGVTGSIATTNPLRRVVANVQVRVGGRDAQVIFAGAVPTVVLGLAQVSFFIPNDAPTGGSVPVEVIIGGQPSQGGVTMAIR